MQIMEFLTANINYYLALLNTELNSSLEPHCRTIFIQFMVYILSVN